MRALITQGGEYSEVPIHGKAGTCCIVDRTPFRLFKRIDTSRDDTILTENRLYFLKYFYIFQISD
eukprot:COSAG05_NODE_1022_length_6130_cov_48.450174_5_plen_65_part_00